LIPTEAESELEPIVVARAWRGHGVGRTLADTVIDAARARGDRQLVTRPVARNDAAIRFFHGLGFDVLGQLELFVDLVPQEERRWRRGVALAGRDFRV
jgi:L-amino acid N-acyltransferase YncA